MRRALLLLCLMLPLTAVRADAVTVRDIIELTRAGLSEPVILALIEVDHSVFSMDTETLRALKDAGVSDAVIVAMIHSGRDQVAVPPQAPPAEPYPPQTDPLQTDPAAPPPQVVVIDHHEDQAPVQQVVVPVAVPVFVPLVQRHHRRVDCRDAQPVFWGFGGKLRPDAWKPPVTRHCR